MGQDNTRTMYGINEPGLTKQDFKEMNEELRNIMIKYMAKKPSVMTLHLMSASYRAHAVIIDDFCIKSGLPEELVKNISNITEKFIHNASKDIDIKNIYPDPDIKYLV